MESVWRHRGIVAGPFLAVAVLALADLGGEGRTLCPFALTTGIACPGCGMTRAASSMIKGDIGAALTYHPLVFLVAAQVVFAWVWYLLRRSGRVQPLGQRAVRLILIANLLALATVWGVRLVNGTLPPV